MSLPLAVLCRAVRGSIVPDPEPCHARPAVEGLPRDLLACQPGIRRRGASSSEYPGCYPVYLQVPKPQCCGAWTAKVRVLPTCGAFISYLNVF